MKLFLFPQNTKDNPIHIINVSIKTADTEDDDVLVTALTSFAQSKVGTIKCFLQTRKCPAVDMTDSQTSSVMLKFLVFFPAPSRKLPSLNMVSEE